MHRYRTLAVGLALAGLAGTPALAQFYGDRPPPPPYGDPYRPPPPPYGDPYRQGDRYDRPPPFRHYGRPPLVCRTEEGSCGPRGPQAYRAHCLCDFGDGPVPGRMKP